MVREYVRSYPEKIRQRIYKSLGVSAGFLPLGAALETAVAGIQDDVSFRSRLLGVAFTACILPAVEDLVQTSSRYVGMDTSERLLSLHNNVLFGAIALTYKTVAYVAAGETDPERVFWGTALTTGLAAFAGQKLFSVGGRFEDAIHPSHAESPSRAVNRRFATRFATASLLATLAVYACDFPRQQQAREEPAAEYVVDGVQV